MIVTMRHVLYSSLSIAAEGVLCVLCIQLYAASREDDQARTRRHPTCDCVVASAHPLSYVRRGEE